MKNKRLIADTMTRSGVEFDTGGLRGEAARLTDELCYAYAAAFASTVASDSARIVVGHDRRASSPRIAAACAAAFADAGREVVYAGCVPASAVALAARRRGGCGVMVMGATADEACNGIRFFGPDGELGLQDARRIAASEVEVPAERIGAELGAVDGSVADDCVRRFVEGFGERALEGLRVGVHDDEPVLRATLHALGARTAPVARVRSGLPRGIGAISDAFERAAVDACARAAFDAVVGIAADGRPMLADADGRMHVGAAVAAIAAVALGSTTVVAPVTAGGALEDCGLLRRVIRTGPPPHRVLDALRIEATAGAVLGCDAEGALLLAAELARDGRRLEALPARDALLPLIAVLTKARAARRSVAAVMADAPSRHVARNALPGFDRASVDALIEMLAADPEHAASTLAPESGGVAALEPVAGLLVRFRNGDVLHLGVEPRSARLACAAESVTRDRAERLCGESLARIARLRGEGVRDLAPARRERAASFQP
jgi:phosphomannomutase